MHYTHRYFGSHRSHSSERACARVSACAYFNGSFIKHYLVDVIEIENEFETHIRNMHEHTLTHGTAHASVQAFSIDGQTNQLVKR